MIGDYVAADLDFSLFEPNVLSASSEKKLIELLLDEDFINDPWLQRRLSCYALADTVERDRIVLEIFKFFFQGTLPSELFAVVRNSTPFLQFWEREAILFINLKFSFLVGL